jgi:putative acetyltransferase
MHIRDFRIGDEMALYAVFDSAVHQLASRDYTADQINAWAARTIDREAWVHRMQVIRPFVMEHSGHIVGYADVQSSGYIDHFYASGTYARQGIGTRLMNRIHQAAHLRGIRALTSNVSRTAEPFFQKFGFVVIERRAPVVRGVVVPNALMRKGLVRVST